MKNIHILCKTEKKNPPRPIARDSNTFTSGTWKFADSTADELIGGNIYFHQGQDLPSHFGGKVTGWEDEGDGRKTVIFERDMDCFGIISRGGWSYEFKITEEL